MADRRLTQDQVLSCFEKTGAQLAMDNSELERIEVLLIGGAAGMLTGALRPERTTLDCDVIEFVPQEIANAVKDAAAKVSSAMGLAEDWLNDHATWYIDIMLEGWKARRRHVGVFGPLDVYAVDRIDLISLKVYANRPQDIEDLEDLKVTQDEAVQVRIHLMSRIDNGFTQNQILPAIEYLDAVIESPE